MSWSQCKIQGQELIRSISSGFSRPSTPQRIAGIGMGLSICRSIIAAHGGRLWAEANRPRGAIFQFTLPAGPEDS